MKRKQSTGIAISRRLFLDATGKYTASGLATLGMLGSSSIYSQGRGSAEQAGLFIPKLAGFITNTRYTTIPAAAVDMAKIAIMDCLGVTVAGGREESAQITGRMVREEGAKEET